MNDAPETDLYELDPRPWCSFTTAAGRLCMNTSVPGDPVNRCGLHGGHRHEKQKGRRAGAPPCRCAAYQWPHRRRSGLCRYPAQPAYRCTTPEGTHREPSGHAREIRRLVARAWPIPVPWHRPRR
jgi:hypothetical protein